MAEFPSTARAVVIGGGINGVSALYHLAKKGWTDVVLLERTELTAGSTWHAAGLLPLFNMSYSVGQLHQYSVELYKTLEAAEALEAEGIAPRSSTCGRSARSMTRRSWPRSARPVAR